MPCFLFPFWKLKKGRYNNNMCKYVVSLWECGNGCWKYYYYWENAHFRTCLHGFGCLTASGRVDVMGCEMLCFTRFLCFVLFPFVSNQERKMKHSLYYYDIMLGWDPLHVFHCSIIKAIFDMWNDSERRWNFARTSTSEQAENWTLHCPFCPCFYGL